MRQNGTSAMHSWTLKPETAEQTLRFLQKIEASLIFPNGREMPLGDALTAHPAPEIREWLIKINFFKFSLPDFSGNLAVYEDDFFRWAFRINGASFAAGCRRPFAVLPQIDKWHSLQVLDLSRNMATSKESSDLSFVAALSGLQVLSLGNWRSLTDISPLGGLTELRSLDLANCVSLSDLTPVTGLIHLQKLDLRHVSCVRDITPLNTLGQLSHLYLRGCEGLTELTPLAGLSNLKRLDLSYCHSIKDLSSLSTFRTLEDLTLDSAEWLENLADFDFLSNLTALRKLSIAGSAALVNLKDLSAVTRLTNIRSLALGFCRRVIDLTPLATLHKLRKFAILDCRDLVDLSPLVSLTSLESLELQYCKSLVDLSPLAGLVELNRLDLCGCESLTDLTPLVSLTALRLINLERCKSLSDLSSLAGLTGLKELVIAHCDSLAASSTIPSSVTVLDWSWCYSLKDLTPLTSLKELESLNLAFSKDLVDLVPIAGLTTLRILNLEGCTSLSDLSPLTSLTALQSLKMDRCVSFAELGPLASLFSLQKLEFYNCELLADLAPLGSLASLQSVDLSGCNRVRTIEALRACSQLRELKSPLHPTIVAELLADLAGRRRDLPLIHGNAGDWLKEAKSSLRENLPESEVFAASLARAFALLGDTSTGDEFQTVLQSAPDFPVKPWKDWFLTTKRESGFDLLQRRIDAIPPAELSPGAIGGASAALPDDQASQPEQTWARAWLAAIEQYHADRGSALRPAAAELCLALARLGEFAALDRWLQRFTDPDDSTAVDQVHAALAEWKLAAGDGDAALAQLSAVVFSQFRDPVLAKLVRFWAPADAHRAMHTLLLLEDQTLRSQLVRELGAGAAGTASPEAVHRLLVAAGTDGGTLAWLIERVGELHPDQTVLDELESGMRASPDDLVGWQLQQLEKMRNKLVAERRMRVGNQTLE